MRTLAIDIETYSSVELNKCGAYRYAESEDFQVLLFAYAFDNQPVQLIDLAQGEKVPTEIQAAIFDPQVVKTAFNAAFERACLAKHFSRTLPPEHWQCTQAHALTLGLPASLGQVAEALKIAQRKDKKGPTLIRYFCTPAKTKQANNLWPRNLPEHDPERWGQFRQYCVQDVIVERAIRDKLQRYPMSGYEQSLWQLDQHINDRGIQADRKLIKQAAVCNKRHQKQLLEEAKRLTGISNPKSVAQLKTWLKDTEGIDTDSLAKESVAQILADTDNPNVTRMLELRQELARTSIKKYQAMARTIGQDDRIRGTLHYYGAGRTGRWAGRLIQPHNLPRNYLKDIEVARDMLKKGSFEELELLFGSIPDTLAQLVRTALIPKDGCRFLVIDFSAIEARILSWLAREQWRLDVFRGHGKIYEASASQMFGIPLAQVNKELRQKGKVAELALGYQGSTGALIKMGALSMGLSETELPGLVSSWRASNPNIVQFWRDVETAAVRAVQEQSTVNLGQLELTCSAGMLFVKLPSNRSLAYARPRIENDPKFNKPCLTYEGQDTGGWGRLQTYGGKLTENIVQAIARDCLAEALMKVDAAGYEIVLHVHDELVVEAPIGTGSVLELAQILSKPLPWAPELPLAAEGFESDYYRKD
ncbi:MAG: hypothetical protein FH749_07945 [Firmicutes bacterium]|nr:hypothetical protein [Bacillota bacterium]